MYVKFPGCIHTKVPWFLSIYAYTLEVFYSPPLKTYHPQRKVVFQPSSFRGYMSVFGAVSVCTSICFSLGEGPSSCCNLPSLKLTVRPLKIGPCLAPQDVSYVVSLCRSYPRCWFHGIFRWIAEEELSP